ncbi:hypothetical protein BMF89_00055 [Arthrobacter sp. SRS-W-1-2016]|uniref:hypothetical protein n=1 Tax=Arthrobacter sp. SRS-W-1-2016 TaxID=1930254 RepID=UPI00099144C9|nr:hypothetical protein [Arthrobacter sp. SRS-W-1-2016]OOP65279.1 hypothetical protein BMF89_00055 [Arthrobacter sp. SRS-W-1-2016]
MPLKNGEHPLTSFVAKKWGREKNPGCVFMGAGFVTFLLCLILVFFIEPMRNASIVIGSSLAIATLAAVSENMSTPARVKSFRVMLTRKVNELILEMTGDPTARVSIAELGALIQLEYAKPLHINGVPGLELKVVDKEPGMKQLIAKVTAPDYGLESFDLLLSAELKRKP